MAPFNSETTKKVTDSSFRWNYQQNQNRRTHRLTLFERFQNPRHHSTPVCLQDIYRQGLQSWRTRNQDHPRQINWPGNRRLNQKSRPTVEGKSPAWVWDPGTRRNAQQVRRPRRRHRRKSAQRRFQNLSCHQIWKRHDASNQLPKRIHQRIKFWASHHAIQNWAFIIAFIRVSEKQQDRRVNGMRSTVSFKLFLKIIRGPIIQDKLVKVLALGLHWTETFIKVNWRDDTIQFGGKKRQVHKVDARVFLF